MSTALAPPRDLMELVGSVDAEDFQRVGREMCVYLLELVGLRPGEDVLEVGCGSGRVAIPLLSYLDEEGSYTGFDVVRPAVEWCHEHITPLNPRFRFDHADVVNDAYNAEGAVVAADYRFPYPDRSFDVVVLTSVFTHLLDDAAQRYLDEIQRVLRPGGRLFSTWFLLDDYSRAAVHAGISEIPFHPSGAPVWSMDPELEEWAVAYDARFVRDLFSDVPLVIDEVIPGRWPARPDGRSFQDIIRAHRIPSPDSGEGEAVDTRYDVAPPFDNPASVHGRELALVGTGKRVLELGCSFGHVSAEMTRRGCAVTGVELDPIAARRAAEVCERVVVADLGTVDLRTELEDERFDVALCGDVLEHLKDPVATLRQVAGLLAPEGYVVASIPNVAHGSIRLALLQGRFDYRDLGLLDRTHIHLFTKASIESTFRDAGMVIADLQEIPVGIFDTEIPVRREDFDPAVVAALEADLSALTYHFLVKAVVDDGSGMVEDMRRRTEELQQELVNTRLALAHESARADEVTRWAEHLVGQLEATGAELHRLKGLLPVRAYAGLRRRAGRDR